MHLSQWIEGLAQLLAPPTCAGCDLAMADSALFCPACEPLVEPAMSGQRPPAATAAVLRYGGPLADAVCRFKYAGRSDLGGRLGAQLAASAEVYAGEVDRVVPLPLHRSRLRERGFNQAALLARPVARRLAIPLDTTTLRRVRPTRAQAGLSPDERLDNVRSAFVATPRSEGLRVLLIDDVRTTGATLTSAALALREAGLVVRATLALAQAD